jgi:hypothetical protein
VRIRLYLDEDSSDTDLLKALRLRGADVLSALEAGMRNESDEAQLRWAAAHGRVMFSSNRRDFYRIHSEWMREGKTHSGIVLILQQTYSIGEQMRRLLRLINALSAKQMVNRIEFLTHWGGP